MLLDEILERNRSYVRERKPRPLSPPETLHLAVVACYDPRLDPLLLPALGLVLGEAFLLRTAGALVQPGSSALRSLGLAVFMFGVTEILIVGHTSCRMATFDASAFIDAFRKRGVPREAFGDDDLRGWAGAIPSPSSGVRLSMSNIRTAQFFPRDLVISGVVLDDTTGALEIVESLEPERVEAEPRGVEPPRAPPHAARRTEHAADADENEGVSALLEAFDALAHSVPDPARWREDLSTLREKIHQSANPLTKLELLDRFARRAGAESAEVRVAFDRLRRETLAPTRKR